MDIQIKEIAETWPSIQNIFSVPHTEQEYLKPVNGSSIFARSNF